MQTIHPSTRSESCPCVCGTQGTGHHFFGEVLKHCRICEDAVPVRCRLFNNRQRRHSVFTSVDASVADDATPRQPQRRRLQQPQAGGAVWTAAGAEQSEPQDDDGAQAAAGSEGAESTDLFTAAIQCVGPPFLCGSGGVRPDACSCLR